MATIDEIIAYKAATYKKRIASRFVLVEGDRIAEKIMGNDFIVTKKIDGVMQLVFIKDGEIKSVSRGGQFLGEEVPAIKEFKRRVIDAGYKQAIIAAELYVKHTDGRRERPGDVPKALAQLAKGTPDSSQELHLAPFDIIELDDENFNCSHYREVVEMLDCIFGHAKLCVPVEAYEASGRSEIKDIYNRLVTDEGAEGLVVHPELQVVYKVKRRHTFDAAVLGYVTSDSDDCSVSSMLFGMKREDGLWQIIGSAATGISEQQRHEIYQMLTHDCVQSDFIETDTHGVAYRMVNPRLVFELSALDIVTENSQGEAKLNPLLELNANWGFHIKGKVAGVSLISFTIKGMRIDKQADEVDVRLSQFTDIIEFGKEQTVDIDNLPKSEVIARKVYTKGKGEKIMVHKFIIFKTNKEQTGVFPAYVLHHTDFSCSRKEPLKRDLRVSSSCKQIFALLDKFIEENIKKGWEEVI